MMSILFASASSQYILLPNDMTISQNVPGFTVFVSGFLPNSLPPAGNEVRLIAMSVNGSVGSSRATITFRNDGIGGFLRCFSRRLDADPGESLDSAPGSVVVGSTYTCALVANWAGGVFQNWVNGALAVSSTPASWTGNSSNTPSSFSSLAARADGAQFLDGLLEGVMVWPRALGAAAIQALSRNRGGLQNARSIAGNVPAHFWPMRGTLPFALGTAVDIWQGVHGTAQNGPTYNRHIGREPWNISVT